MDDYRNIILAILAQTKFGKSTFLALLSGIYLRLLEIFSSSKYGRTKVLTEFYYDRDNTDPEIRIMDIVFKPIECLGGFNNDVVAYNNNYEEKKEILATLGFKPLRPHEVPRQYLSRVTEYWKTIPLTNEMIGNLLCKEGIDRFVKKIVLRVPASDELKAYMEEHKVTLSIRDTKGLMDLAMGEAAKKQYVSSLSDIGLDNLTAALCGCSESYPNFVQEMYQDTIYNVFNSIPTFLFAKDKSLYRSFIDYIRQIPDKDGKISENGGLLPDVVRKFIEKYQNGEISDYAEMDDEIFYDTQKWFEDLGLMYKKDGVYDFSETFFEKRDTEFIIPTCTSLKKYGSGDISAKQLKEEMDFLFLKSIVNMSLIDVLDKITLFKDNVEKLKKDGYAKEFMLRAAECNREDLMADLERYNNNPHSLDASRYCKPQFEGMTSKDIQMRIDDPKTAILGTHGGITTRGNGRWQFPATGVTAVSARKWLDHIIGCVVVTEDIRDREGKLMFEGLEGDLDAQTRLVKNILRNCLYKDYTDMNASFQIYNIVDRYRVSWSIEERRRAPSLDPAFKQVIEMIVNDFCNVLAKSDVGAYGEKKKKSQR